MVFLERCLEHLVLEPNLLLTVVSVQPCSLTLSLFRSIECLFIISASRGLVHTTSQLRNVLVVNLIDLRVLEYARSVQRGVLLSPDIFV